MAVVGQARLMPGHPYYELATPLQTDKIERMPLILASSEIWGGLVQFICDRWVRKGKLTTEEIAFIRLVDAPDEVVQIAREVPAGLRL